MLLRTDNTQITENYQIDNPIPLVFLPKILEETNLQITLPQVFNTSVSSGYYFYSTTFAVENIDIGIPNTKIFFNNIPFNIITVNDPADIFTSFSPQTIVICIDARFNTGFYFSSDELGKSMRFEFVTSQSIKNKIDQNYINEQINKITNNELNANLDISDGIREYPLNYKLIFTNSNITQEVTPNGNESTINWTTPTDSVVSITDAQLGQLSYFAGTIIDTSWHLTNGNTLNIVSNPEYEQFHAWAEIYANHLIVDAENVKVPDTSDGRFLRSLGYSSSLGGSFDVNGTLRNDATQRVEGVVSIPSSDNSFNGNIFGCFSEFNAVSVPFNDFQETGPSAAGIKFDNSSQVRIDDENRPKYMAQNLYIKVINTTAGRGDIICIPKNTIAYTVKNLIQFNGNIYRCINNTVWDGTLNSDWENINQNPNVVDFQKIEILNNTGSDFVEGNLLIASDTTTNLEAELWTDKNLIILGIVDIPISNGTTGLAIRYGALATPILDFTGKNKFDIVYASPTTSKITFDDTGIKIGYVLNPSTQEIFVDYAKSASGLFPPDNLEPDQEYFLTLKNGLVIYKKNLRIFRYFGSGNILYDDLSGQTPSDQTIQKTAPTIFSTQTITQDFNFNIGDIIYFMLRMRGSPGGVNGIIINIRHNGIILGSVKKSIEFENNYFNDTIPVILYKSVQISVGDTIDILLQGKDSDFVLEISNTAEPSLLFTNVLA